MTISGTATDIVVDGDGLTSTFSYDFYMGGSSAYAVLVFTDTDGTQTTIAAADFTITGVTSQSGGTFTYPLVGSPIAVGATLTLSRVLPVVQSAAIGNQGNFYPSVVEGALDYQTMVSQQLAAGSGQTIDAESLFGNASASSGAGQSIAVGSGLSFSGTTLVVSGISGSGTVTEVNTGAGLTGGPITGVGTVAVNTSSITPAMISFSGALVSMTASQTTANYTTPTAIAFDREIIDVGGWHSNTVANTRLTVPSGVSYVKVTGNVIISAASANDSGTLYIYKGGSQTWDGCAAAREASSNTSLALSISTGPVAVTASEYFELFYLQQSDTSITVVSTSTNFSIMAVG